MTYLDAALAVLQAADQPLHYGEITTQALAQGLIEPSGLTPEATMGSRLYTATKEAGSLFVRTEERAVFGLVEWQPQGINGQVRAINLETRAQLGALLHRMPADRFEVLVGNLLLEMGFDENSVEVTRRSHDGGIDVVGTYRAAGLAEVSAAVQVKRWKKNVGAPTVTQLRGSLQVHQQGIIITTSGFSRRAKEEATAANKSRIGLIDGEELLDLLIKHRVGVAEETLKVLSLDEAWWGALLGEDAGIGDLGLGIGELVEKLGEEEGFDTASGLLNPRGSGGEEEKPTKPAARQASTKPTGVVLFGERYPVSEWWEVILVTCEVLAARHGVAALAAAGETVRGRTRTYLATSGEGMTRPKAVGSTGLVVEVNFSAKDCVRVAERFLGAMGDGVLGVEIGP